MKNTQTLILTNRIESIAHIHEFIQKLGVEWTLSDTIIGQVILAVEELVTNTINYGYSDNKLHEIHVTFKYQQGILEIAICDDANPFDPISTPSPDVEASLEDRRIGGLGIYLVRKTMDTVHYERRNNENHTMVTKKIT